MLNYIMQGKFARFLLKMGINLSTMKIDRKMCAVHAVTWLLLQWVCASCGSTLYNETGNVTTTRSDMRTALRHADTIAIVYSGSDKQVQSVLLLLQQQIAGDGDNTALLISEEAGTEINRLSDYPLYLIGTTQHLEILKDFANAAPYHIVPDGFEFNGIVYGDKTDLLKIALYPNPKNNSMPLTAIMANSDSVLSDYLRDALNREYGYFFWDNWGYQVYRNHNRIVVGNFSEDTPNAWQIDKKVHWEFDYTGKTVGANAYCQFIAHNTEISKVQLDSVSSYIATCLREIEDFTGRKISAPFTYHIYPSTEVKGLMLNNTDQSNASQKLHSVYAVWGNEFQENYKGDEMLLAVRNMLGKAQLQCIESGLATMFNRKWCTHGYKYWAIKLFRSGNMPTLDQLLDDTDFKEGSPYLMECTAALFAEFLIHTAGRAQFIARYGTFSREELITYEQAWNAFVDAASETYPSMQEPEWRSPTTYLNGFNFAHEGYQIFNGYLGSTSDASLQQLQSLGANAVSIIPYGFLQEMDKPAPFHFARGPGSENDESIIKCAYTAKKYGMQPMLKPQLWTWKGWTGDLKMHSEAEWQQFFTYYYNWIIHYAFLAELYHIDLFCIGVEFREATLTHENEWIDIFTKVRGLYSGKITYAANWGDEIENVGFWKSLDYISVNFYYPLSDKQDASDAELQQQFEIYLDSLEAVHNKYNKPVLITEIGYKSIDFPWLEPHADNDEQNYNESSQRRCYEVMFRALQDEDWIAGIYIWQWPSYMDYISDNPKGFTPCGKEAEAVVRKWFAQR